MKSFSFVFISLIFSSIFFAQQKPFLSNLNATKNSPLYTTYAAATERSEFMLDEGYHFLFYDLTRGADFVTDKAGDWSLSFRKGKDYVSSINEMYKEPVITVSYPDLVKYHFYPFENVKVDVLFLVYSSHTAIQDITITNLGSQKTVLDLICYLQNNYRSFNEVQILKEINAITFSHEEFPDGWVLDHKVPYVDKVYNSFLFSEPMDRFASFRSYKWGPVEIPQKIEIEKQSEFLVWGRILHKNGERCRHLPPKLKMMVMLNNDKSRILTENAPRWGSTETNVNAYSLYGAELGNFGTVKMGDIFTYILSCKDSNQDVVINGTVTDTSKGHEKRIDAKMNDTALINAPQGVKRDIWGSGTELRLYWKKDEPGVRYNVYRRDYLNSGVYELIASSIEQPFFTDKNIPEGKVYGYVVTAVDEQGHMSMHSDEVNNIEGSDFLTDVKYPGQLNGNAKDLAKIISASKRFEIAAGASKYLRIVRTVRRLKDDENKTIAESQKLFSEDLNKYIEANEKLFSAIPTQEFNDSDKEMLYWTAFSLMRQVILPPEGECSYNYYVFSREPQWGWGHGGQVFHESLTMLAYAMMDNISAMNSQRVYRERQHEDGYINYRTGSFLNETIPNENQLTTSAPWYAWQNWEIYKTTKDKKFLEEMYKSSKAFYEYYVKNRDSDSDGLCEWGGEAVLESVRDALVAVWDEVGYPSNFEGVDVNSMLVQEEKALSLMANELDKNEEAKVWKQRADARTKKINDTMWDDSTGFYYNIERMTNTFTHKKINDLKREEIIGFLPLWAGVANEQQAKILMQKLTDPKKFWRKYGVPTLAADDSYYNPKGYWNGPVWVQWNYLIEHGLIDYGYKAEAKELVDRVAANMIGQLKKDHNFWEFYSPDEQWAGYNKTYLWAGIITRMMLDVLN